MLDKWKFWLSVGARWKVIRIPLVGPIAVCGCIHRNNGATVSKSPQTYLWHFCSAIACEILVNKYADIDTSEISQYWLIRLSDG